MSAPSLTSQMHDVRIFQLLLQRPRSSVQRVLLLFSLCCLPQNTVPQLNVPFASGFTYLPPFQKLPFPGPVAVHPPRVQASGTHTVEMFYDDIFYVCEKKSPVAGQLNRFVSVIFRIEEFYPEKKNCSEVFHPLYLQRYPGRTSKSLIGLDAKYTVLSRETTDVVLHGNNIVSIPSHYFCNLRNVTNLVIHGIEVQMGSSKSFGFSQQCVSNDCNLILKMLQLTENGIMSLIAGSFCGFPNLQELDLSKNSINSADEDAFLKLDNLLKLSLSKNQLSALPRGVFQPLNKTLRELDLSDNQLTDEVFSRLELLSELTVLRLSNNNISAIHDNGINGLESLIELHLDNNQIVTLKSPFDKVQNLVTLILGTNSIQHISNTTLFPLVNLTVLNLEHNRIEQLSSAHFSSNNVLEHLDITSNHFSAVPDLKLVKSLKRLVLDANKIRAITPEVGRIICNLSNLEELHIASNSLANIYEESLDCIQNLTFLNLNNNYLRSIRGTFSSIKVRRLDLARNVIKELWLDDIPQAIVEVDLTGNNITMLKSPFKQRLRDMSLTRLKLDDNQISDMSSVHLPPSLQYLSLGRNSLEVVNLGNFELVNNGTSFALDNLQALILSSNKIQSVCPLIFYLIAIETIPNLGLINNPLSCGCEINFLKNYEERMWPGETIPELPESGTCPSWQQNSVNKEMSGAVSRRDRFSCPVANSYPYCRCNQNSFYSNICNFPCPERCFCYLSGDYTFQLVNCTGAGFDNFPMLLTQLPLELHFSNNSLKGINDTMLRSYSKAVELHLNDNRISSIENGAFRGVPDLQVLNLETNLLKSLPDEAFENLFKLTELYLAHNRLMYLTSQVFWPLHGIRVLNLHDNNLRNFSVWNFNVGSSTLARLSLRDNPWSCDCHYVEQFRNWLQNYSDVVEDVSKLFCTADNGTVQDSPLIAFNSSQCYMLKDEIFITNVALWTSVLASMIFLSLMCVMMFVYRREMQVLIYSNYGVRLFYKNTEEVDGDKLYDAFVAHSALDEDFLVDYLIPGLEQIEQPYRLCIHQRDFLVGAVITDSILEAVEKSRRTIVLLSENFVRSEWCRFEFKSAHLKTLADRCNRLIVIVLGKLPTDLDPEMNLYLKTNTYLEWSDRLFWEKLYFALPDRRPAESHSV